MKDTIEIRPLSRNNAVGMKFALTPGEGEPFGRAGSNHGSVSF
jgi:hypothetical protein